MCGEICADNRFEIIEKAKQDLIESTNIKHSNDEMKVLDNILFRAWQMGWLKQYDDAVHAIPVKDIVERITALSYMANEKKYSQAERESFQTEATNLITLLKDFGYGLNMYER